jgi:uncharacterized protein (TIGR02466 family)
MEHKKYDIFPTLVMKFNLNRRFTEKELNFVIAEEQKCNKNYANKSSTNTYILNESELSDINTFCNNALEFYFDEVYKPLTKVKSIITQSWLNYTNIKQHHHGHTHPNSLISGVLYIKANKEIDRICFGRTNYKQISIAERERNDYNTDEVEFKVGEGELILFPSNLYHRVPPKEDDTVRISLAFNSFVKGEIGFVRSLNYLEL